MGANFGKGANAFAIQSLANESQVSKQDVIALSAKFHEISSKHGNPETISKEDFGAALSIIGITNEKQEILDRIFEMVDSDNDGQIFFRNFLLGLAPLISGEGKDKLHFAFEMFSSSHDGRVSNDDMKQVLLSMNSSSDKTEKEIEDVVGDISEKHGKTRRGSLNYGEFISAAVEHPVLLDFITQHNATNTGVGK